MCLSYPSNCIPSATLKSDLLTKAPSTCIYCDHSPFLSAIFDCRSTLNLSTLCRAASLSFAKDHSSH